MSITFFQKYRGYQVSSTTSPSFQMSRDFWNSHAGDLNFCSSTYHVWHFRQHLKRSHRSPIYCARCYQTFKTEELLKTHQRVPTDRLCPVNNLNPFERDINADQWERIKQRKVTTGTVEEQWYKFYKILFDDGRVFESICKFVRFRLHCAKALAFRDSSCLDSSESQCFVLWMR